jgi:hypothetical protein
MADQKVAAGFPNNPVLPDLANRQHQRGLLPRSRRPSRSFRVTAHNDEHREDRDHPLVLRYSTEPDWLKPLSLPKAPSRHELARAQIAAIAVDKARHEQPYVSYSRNKNHYGRRGTRYDERPDLYRYAVIVRAVDTFAAAGYFENIVAPNNPRCGWQSAFRATPALIEALGNAPPPLAKLRPRALIRLRDENKQLIDFRDTEQTSRMRHRVAEINEAISAQVIGLPREIGEHHGDVLVIGDTCVNLGNTACFRIFNESFKHGGRFYGHYTQSLPKAVRARLTINGEPVAEPDYPAHHLHILYAMEGLPRPSDPYEIDGWTRDIVKRGVLILINASTLRSAIGALIDRYGIDGSAAAHLITNIKNKHKLIATHFHSGAGRRLQRLDSDMAERVQLGLTRQGIVALPIHDSFIVPERHENVAREQMAEAFETVVSRASDASRKPQAERPLRHKATYTTVESLRSVSSSSFSLRSVLFG